MNTHHGLLTQDFTLLKPWGQGTFHWVVLSPTSPFPMLIWMSPFLTLLPPPSLFHPECTVYNRKRANRRIFFLGGICRTWDVCIYKYIIYINIYNTDLKNQIPLTYIFFNLCQKCVFRENLIFILRLCIVTHLYKCASSQHGPCPAIWKCHTHTYTDCTKRLASLFLWPWPLPPTS